MGGALRIAVLATIFVMVSFVASTTFHSRPAGAAAGHVRTATMSAATGDAGSGVDPAEIKATTGRLGYHEQRKYPYAMVAFLVGLTVFVLLVTWRYREPTRHEAA